MVTIFSGFRIPFDHYNKLLEFYPEVESMSCNGFVFVGERLAPFLDSGDTFDLDLIRQWSVTDKVRKTRFSLWEVDEGYVNVYPKLYIL